MPGVLPYQRVTEPFKDEVAIDHHDGHSILKVSKRLSLGQATVGRYYKSYLQRKFNEHKDTGRKNRGLTHLMRMHEWTNMKEKSLRNLNRYLSENPSLKAVYDFKQKLIKIILTRVYSKRAAAKVILQFLDAIRALKTCGFRNLETLGNILENWNKEIVRMRRFSKTNSITVGLHRRMDEMQNRAYGMHNFRNYRISVKTYCS